jgi:hypothetical protein
MCIRLLLLLCWDPSCASTGYTLGNLRAVFSPANKKPHLYMAISKNSRVDASNDP